MPKELNEFFNRFGTDTTNNFQLLHWGKQLGLKNFQVLMKDEIKNIDVKPLMNIICNIENSFEDGAHWSCFHKQSVKTHKVVVFTRTFGLILLVDPLIKK